MIAWFTRNGVAANLLMISILAIGTWTAMTQIPLEVFPSSDIDTVVISTTFRGATPGEVEEAVIVPIEEAIQSIESIKEIRSSAREGSGTVSVEIKGGYDPREALDDLKTQVDSIVTFPAEVEPPTVSLQPFLDSVVKIIVYGDLEEAQLRQMANEVYDEVLGLKATSRLEYPWWLPLDRIYGLGGFFAGALDATSKTEDISSADIIGVRPYEIGVEVSERELLRYDMTIAEVATAVSAQSVDLSGGTIKTAGGEILLRTKSKAYYGKDFENIVVRSNSDGTKVRVKDVAKVNDGFEETEVEARYNGKPAVLISVNRTGDQNAIAVSDAVKAYVVEKAHDLPQSVKIESWRDRSGIVRGRLDTLIRNGLGALLLVFLLLAMFLRISLGFWVMLGIPIALCGAFFCMPVFDVSINIASLFGFILVLGILVDDAIVTGENIYTKLKTIPDPTEAAILGTKEVARPVIFGVLTTVVAFIPLLLFPGHRGAMFRSIPAVVIPVLLFSLIESKLILPAHLKHMRPRNDTPSRWNLIAIGQAKIANSLEWFVANVYQPVLNFSLKNRWPTWGVFCFLLLFTIGWAASGRIHFVFFPRIASEYLTVRLTMPTGTPYQVTATHADKLERIAFDLRDKYVDNEGSSLITHIFCSVGGQGLAGAGGPSGKSVKSGKPNEAELTLEVLDREARELKGFLDVTPRKISMELRKMIGQIPGAEDFTIKAEIGRYGDPVDVKLAGLNEVELGAAADAVKARLTRFEGLFDIASNVDDGKEELRLNVKSNAQILGIDVDELARQTRGAFFGFEAQRIQRGRDDVRVMVRYPLEERSSIPSLRNMQIRTPQGERVPFANVAELQFGKSPSRISRVNRERTVNVKADADKERVDLESIKAALREDLPKILANFPSVKYELAGEAQEQSEANNTLQTGFIFVLFIIYCMLAIPFRSLLQPLIVLQVIPFGFVGAVWGHVFIEWFRASTGHPEPMMPLSLLSFFGLLALMGVVVNDSLVLVDWVNRKREEGLSVFDAVSTGGGARFRPIILTSITTFAGLVPLIFFERSTQAQFLIPMAISLGFGILFATAITLFLIPVSYLMLEDIKTKLGGVKSWWVKPFEQK